MTPAAVLAALDSVGVRLRLEADGTVRLHGTAPPPPEVLALARTHRDGIAALLRHTAAGVPITSLLPGIPTVWSEGVARLVKLPAPFAVTSQRWAVLAATSARLLRDHGAELHGAGWDALDIFGLHAVSPATNPSGWGLAWLLTEHGEVLDMTQDAVGMRRTPDGARMTFYKRRAPARAGILPAWNLPGGSA